MKNLILTVSVLGATALAAGCTTSTPGTITASWDLQDWNDTTGVATDNAPCPSGADTVIVYALPVGDQNAADADKDLFNCTDGGGITAGHLTGSYQVWVTVTDHSGAVKYAESNTQTPVPVSAGVTTPVNFKFQVNRGYVTAEWSLRGGTSGSNLTCTSANVPAVEMDNMVGTSTPISDQFNCAPLTGTANPLKINTYAVGLQAVDSSPTPVGLGPLATAGTADIQFGNDAHDQGAVVLSVDGK
jgi:hypothetical protein